jgi:hypothetical protein
LEQSDHSVDADLLNFQVWQQEHQDALLQGDALQSEEDSATNVDNIPLACFINGDGLLYSDNILGEVNVVQRDGLPIGNVNASAHNGLGSPSITRPIDGSDVRTPTPAEDPF